MTEMELFWLSRAVLQTDILEMNHCIYDIYVY